ncbi:MAG: hypothetical protein JWO57_1079, partial [Pseudonocardiales bacterium]|nr:hypothetical protein [Pseudonocardiales bacterium]
AGGVLGFFARQRVAVHYEVTPTAAGPLGAPPTAVPARPGPALAPSAPSPELVRVGGPLDELITAVDVLESGRKPGPLDAQPTNVEFAQMLMELAARKAADRAVEPAMPRPEEDPADPHARSAFTLRRQLAELGVPIDRVPPESADHYRVVEHLVATLPDAPEAPTGPGDLLVVAGPAAAAVQAADAIRRRMRLRADSVWAAGCPDGAVPAERSITDPWQAATVAAEARLTGRGPTIVVVSTDDDGIGGDGWAGAVVRAMAPEALWALVDATRKPSDTRAGLRAIGRPDALIVSGAARTASPASVWELDAPVAILDGRPATRGAWAVLLLDKLAELSH